MIRSDCLIWRLQMAKKLSWDTLNVNDLIMKHEDDPYIDFPLLQLETIEIANKVDLLITTNSVRGIKDTGEEKRGALNCSLEGGWDRSSWPIPYLFIDSCKEIFDRRHTKKSIDGHKHIKVCPAARYIRKDAPELGWLNNLRNRSIMECAAIYGNIFSPVPADTKNHHFVTAALVVLELESKKDASRKEIRELLNLMGIQSRYEHAGTITQIVNEIFNSLNDSNSVAGKVSHHTDQDEIDTFIARKDNDFKAHDTEDEFTHHIIKTIEDNNSFLKRYADDVIRKTLEINNEGKLAKFLIVNTANKQAKKIKGARERFITNMIYSWNLRRENILDPIPEDLLNLKSEFRKNLHELNVEIWIKDQIEGETEPFLVDLELAESNYSGE